MRAAVLLGVFGVLLHLERRRPLRAEVQPKARRDLRNLSVAAIAAASVAIAETPVTNWLTRRAARRRTGLVHRLGLPGVARTALAVVLMDYTLFVWHYLTHRSKLLWRVHAAHHVDLDLDATTALRFHFGELLASVPWRAAQIELIGVTPEAFAIWQLATTIAIGFHHSNIRLPLRLEKVLALVFVTPRMHGIHHSKVDDECSSNWSTIFSFPDRLHGTFRLDVPGEEVEVGVPGYDDERELTFGRVLSFPLWFTSRGSRRRAIHGRVGGPWTSV